MDPAQNANASQLDPKLGEQRGALERGLGLKEAVALNMIEMVGIGPFVVIPLVIKAMGGPQCLLAWAASAVLALLDGFVWSELGAAMPLAGGSYVFLRESYGPGRWGRLMSFLLIWQTLIQAPLVLLYRRIATIGKISLLLCVGVIGTFVWLIWGGATHFDLKLAFTYPPGAWHLSPVFFAGLGSAMVSTIYSYWGYYNICQIGGEIRSPERNIPRGIFISIAGIAVLYLLMQTSILGVLPWQKAQDSPFIVSAFVERIYGSRAADVATVMILWIAFASVFSALLGYSRVVYSAALDGNFFAPFAKLHPQKHFPHLSLIFLGTLALVFSLLFKLGTVIAAILAMRLIVQFIGQAVGLMLLRRRWPSERLPFKMWLYPLPALLAIAGWAWLFSRTGQAVWWGLLVIILGAGVFLIRARLQGEWPFHGSFAGAK